MQTGRCHQHVPCRLGGPISTCRANGTMVALSTPLPYPGYCPLTIEVASTRCHVNIQGQRWPQRCVLSIKPRPLSAPTSSVAEFDIDLLLLAELLIPLNQSTFYITLYWIEAIFHYQSRFHSITCSSATLPACPLPIVYALATNRTGQLETLACRLLRGAWQRGQ